MKPFFLVLSLTMAVAARGDVASHVLHAQVAGIDVYADKTGLQELVILRGYLPAGDVFDPPQNPALASVVAAMLDKGTTRHPKFELAAQLEKLGASISFSSGSQVVTFSARCLKEDLPVVLDLLAEQLREPAFAPEEFTKLQKQLIGSLQRRKENTDAVAEETLTRAIFPLGHPNRAASTDELIAAVKATTIEDLKAFHAAHYGPAYLKLVAAGDVDLPALQAGLERSFAGWTGGTPLPEPPAPTRLSDLKQEQVAFVPGKTSVSVLIGQTTGLKYRDHDALALKVGTTILGSGFTGRLMHTVRDQEGLTYGINAGTDGDAFTDGYWTISGTFAPALADRGVQSARKQLDLWWREGISSDELVARKESLVGGFQVGLATTGGLANNLVAALQRGVGVEWLDQYPQRVRALTVHEVNAAMKKYLDPKTMVTVEAGSVGP